MCLLVKQPQGNEFSTVWLKDFYEKNGDGIGIMWAENNSLYFIKQVPTSFEDMAKFYKEHAAGRECAIHWRWRTHGDIDLENCHPYKVFDTEDGYPLYLMHNGVLTTGNSKDPTKSDTWHYIQDYIRPMLMGRPAAFMEPWFREMIESHIGINNKFIMLDAYGNMEIFNESEGVMWQGNWMSNTYAWDAQAAGVKTSYYGGYHGVNYGMGFGSRDWDDYDYATPTTRTAPGGSLVPAIGKGAGKSEGKKFDAESERDSDDSLGNKLEADADVIQIMDAEDFADLLYDTLEDMNMTGVSVMLSREEITAFYMDDPYVAESFLSIVAEGSLTADDVMAYFDKRLYEHRWGNSLQVGMI